MSDYNERKYGLIKRMRRKEEVLSHSSFNEFCKSPRHFIAYKLKEKKTTDAMLFGSMVHVSILEPDRFDDTYFVAPKCDRRTKKGKEDWANAILEAGNKDIVKSEDYETAKRIAEAVRRNDAAGYALNMVKRFETPIEWEYGGWRWRGIIDGDGEENGMLLDLKVLADAAPRKAENYVKYEGAGRQAVHYLTGKGKPLDYYILVVDRGCNISLLKLGKGLLNQLSREVDFYLQQLQKCIFLNSWNSSYDFYRTDGYYEINSL